jgi:hypothetical protein
MMQTLQQLAETMRDIWAICLIIGVLSSVLAWGYFSEQPGTKKRNKRNKVLFKFV